MATVYWTASYFHQSHTLFQNKCTPLKFYFTNLPFDVAHCGYHGNPVGRKPRVLSGTPIAVLTECVCVCVCARVCVCVRASLVLCCNVRTRCVWLSWRQCGPLAMTTRSRAPIFTQHVDLWVPVPWKQNPLRNVPALAVKLCKTHIAIRERMCAFIVKRNTVRANSLRLTPLARWRQLYYARVKPLSTQGGERRVISLLVF